MEQFMKLPPGQKAAVLAAILAVLGVGMYFMLVDPELARAENARKELSRVEQDLAKAREEASPVEHKRLRKAMDDLTELDKENRKMLPAAEEVPDFIESVQKDAKNVGMRVLRFDRLPDESSNLYNASPIRMSVQGTMKELIQFMRIYAGTERRVINIVNLGIDRVFPPDAELIAAIRARKPLLEKAQTGATKTPEQTLLDNIELAEESRKQSQVRATFTAYAYTWTGKPAAVVEGAAATVKKKKKRT